MGLAEKHEGETRRRPFPADHSWAADLEHDPQGTRGLRPAGTCHAAVVPGVEVAGKTGTPSALDGSGVTHAWFVGFAPAEKPQIALIVFLDRGTGEHAAAPLAGRLLRHYFAVGRKRGVSSERH